MAELVDRTWPWPSFERRERERCRVWFNHLRDIQNDPLDSGKTRQKGRGTNTDVVVSLNFKWTDRRTWMNRIHREVGLECSDRHVACQQRWTSDGFEDTQVKWDERFNSTSLRYFHRWWSEMMIRSIPVIDQCSDIQMSDLSEIDSLSIPSDSQTTSLDLSLEIDSCLWGGVRMKTIDLNADEWLQDDGDSTLASETDGSHGDQCHRAFSEQKMDITRTVGGIPYKSSLLFIEERETGVDVRIVSLCRSIWDGKNKIITHPRQGIGLPSRTGHLTIGVDVDLQSSLAQEQLAGIGRCSSSS